MSANNEVNTNSEISEWMLDGSLLYRLQFGVNCDEINVTMTNRSRKESDRAVVAGQLLKHLSLAQPVPEPVGYAGEDDIAEIKTYSPAIIAIYSEQHEPTDKPVYLSPIPSDLLTRTIDAIHSVMRMDVKNHELQDRLQFTPAGREILGSVNAVLADLRKIGGIK